jgi:class 3 adenylate cyclase
MSLPQDAAALFAALRPAADPAALDAIEALVAEAPDRALCRVNALDFAAARGLDPEAVIAAFLHAARVGLFELSWNVLCPGCGGVLHHGATLKGLDRREYACALCAAGYEATLDELVEVTFTVSPRARRIAAHDPHTLPMAEYFRQVFWGSGVALPPQEALERLVEEVTLDAVDLPAGERAVLSLQLPEAFLILFDPVTHTAQFLEVAGAPTRERQSLPMVLDGRHDAPTPTVRLRPGPLRIALENRTADRCLPGVWVAGEALHGLLGARRPFLTAARLLTNQTFRDLYGTDTLDLRQRLKITSLTFPFTDLTGSTELYDRIGDLAAYDLVQAHFRALGEIVAAQGGAMVKTIGDAVMATFPSPDRAVAAALGMREAVRALGEGLDLKIGIHEGPCLAVMLNNAQDYFGQTVNLAARVQGLCPAGAILATAKVVEAAAALLRGRGVEPRGRDHALRGIARRVAVYELA